MTKYEILWTTRFKRDFKAISKRGYDISLLTAVIEILANGDLLAEKYNDHPLKGNLTGKRECHITSDWLLIYEFEADKLILYLTRTGTHSDLFDE